MGSNISARPAVSDELTALRSAGQSTRRYLAIQTPQEVFRCRVNQTFDTTDSVAEFEYDDDTGGVDDVFESMTAYVSGVAFGGYEKGIVRVRKSPTADTFYIAESSDIAFLDNDYITVMDLMPPAARALHVRGGVVFADFDIQFGTVVLNAPIPMLGPIAAVITLEPDALNPGDFLPYEFTPADPSLSYSPDGADIDSFLYSCPDAVSVTDEDTTEPIITIDTPGMYRFSCLVTDEFGRSSIAHRWIFANPPNPFYTADDPEGDAGSGNFSFGVECRADTTLDDIPERAMCVLYEVSYYDGQPLPLGPIEAYENIKAVGWIENESITRDPESGVVRFRVQGPAFWASALQSAPFELSDSSVDASNWMTIKEMTVDRGLAHFLQWFTNLTQIMDCTLTGDTKRIQSLPAPEGSLWEQIRALALPLFAGPMVNHLGQLFIEIDQQYIADADRDALPVIMTLAKADIVRGSLTVENVTIPQRSFVELGGVGPFDGTRAVPYFSRAPGTTPKPFGSPDSPTSYIFDDQDDCNFKAGCMLAIANNKYQISFVLAHNNGLISITPRQYLIMSIAEGDTPRGITLTNARVIPRSIAPRRNKETGEVQTVITCEVEAIGGDGRTYIPPQPPQSNMIEGFEDYGFGDFAGLDTNFPELVPGPLDLGECVDDLLNGPYTMKWSKRVLYGNIFEAAGRTAEAYFPCTIRPDSFVFETELIPNIRLFNGAAGHVTFTAIKGGADVLTLDLAGGIISGVSEIPIDGLRVVLDYDPVGDGQHALQEDAPEFARGSLVMTTAGFDDVAPATISGLVPGQWYEISSVGSIMTGAGANWKLDGIGPMGQGGFGSPAGETPWDGQTYYDTGRIRPSFSSVDNAGGTHFQDYRLYFMALKSSYEILMGSHPSFGTLQVNVYNATIDNPRVVILGDSQISNVCSG